MFTIRVDASIPSRVYESMRISTCCCNSERQNDISMGRLYQPLINLLRIWPFVSHRATALVRLERAAREATYVTNVFKRSRTTISYTAR